MLNDGGRDGKVLDCLKFSGFFRTSRASPVVEKFSAPNGIKF